MDRLAFEISDQSVWSKIAQLRRSTAAFCIALAARSPIAPICPGIFSPASQVFHGVQEAVFTIEN